MKPLELSRTFRINGSVPPFVFFFVSTERKPEQNSNGRHFFLCSLKYFTDYKLNCQSPADTVTLVLKLLSKIYDTISQWHVLFVPIEDTSDCRFDVNDACVCLHTCTHTVAGSLTDPRETTCFVVKSTLPADLIFE